MVSFLRLAAPATPPSHWLSTIHFFRLPSSAVQSPTYLLDSPHFTPGFFCDSICEFPYFSNPFLNLFLSSPPPRTLPQPTPPLPPSFPMLSFRPVQEFATLHRLIFCEDPAMPNSLLICQSRHLCFVLCFSLSARVSLCVLYLFFIRANCSLHNFFPPHVCKRFPSSFVPRDELANLLVTKPCDHIPPLMAVYSIYHLGGLSFSSLHFCVV